MFVGHTAAALVGKRTAPEQSLGAWIAAACALDLLWPVFLLTGVEHVRIDPGNTAFTPLAFDSYPWSHSLLMVIVWGAAGGVVARAFGAGRRAQIVVFLLVLSHWLLDAVTHRPDLPLWPGRAPLAGLGLWNSIAATLLVEGLLFAFAIGLYLKSAPPRSRAKRLAFGALVVFQSAIWASQPFGPPPPSVTAIGWVGLAGWLFVAWGWAIDRATSSSSASS